MKKNIAIMCALLFASTCAIAEEHAAEALKHAGHAVTHGQAGHAPQLVEHAENATKHAEEAVTHLQAGNS